MQDAYDLACFPHQRERRTCLHWAPLPLFLWTMGCKCFRLPNSTTEKRLMIDGNYYALTTINLSDRREWDHHWWWKHYRTNANHLTFDYQKCCVHVLVLLMFVLFWNSFNLRKNGGLAGGVGRFLEPIVLYVRDDIARPNIERKSKTYQLLTYHFLLYLVPQPLGMTLLGKVLQEHCILFIENIDLTTTMLWNERLLVTHFWSPWKHHAMVCKTSVVHHFNSYRRLGIFIKPFPCRFVYTPTCKQATLYWWVYRSMFIFKSCIGSPLSFGLAFAISLIEFSCLLQAYIFTMLSALYFGFAAEEHLYH